MIINKNTLVTMFVFSLFILASTEVFSQSDTNKEPSGTQKVQKLESGRTNELKSDADLKGRTEENKGNFDKDVPQGDGIEYPPAKSPNPSDKSK